MASIVGSIDVNTLKVRQDAAREQRHNRPLTQRPFAVAFRDLTVLRGGELATKRDKKR
jgi:hypothetical protein